MSTQTQESGNTSGSTSPIPSSDQQELCRLSESVKSLSGKVNSHECILVASSEAWFLSKFCSDFELDQKKKNKESIIK